MNILLISVSAHFPICCLTGCVFSSSVSVLNCLAFHVDSVKTVVEDSRLRRQTAASCLPAAGIPSLMKEPGMSCYS